jgi:hypothetical protein
VRPLTAEQLLQVWEGGRSASAVRRGMLLLCAASPDVPVEVLRSLPVGRRDARLLLLRRWTFGEEVEGVVDCPGCGDRMELTFRVGEVLLPEPEGRAGELSLERDGYAVRFRLPHCGDLEALESAVGADRSFLLGRCLLEGWGPEGGAVPAGALPGEVVAAVAAAMEEADPQAVVQLASDCPSCGHRWSTGFDILTWFWDEIEAWGRRTLLDVHTLARAYGWSEREILALGAWRRQSYLELAGR